MFQLLEKRTCENAECEKNPLASFQDQLLLISSESLVKNGFVYKINFTNAFNLFLQDAIEISGDVTYYLWGN